MEDIDNLKRLVNSAIAESCHLNWSDLRNHILGDNGYEEFTLIILKGWLRSYTEEFSTIFKQLPSDQLEEGLDIVNTFFSKTIMNGLLDWYDVTYVFRHELSTLVEDMTHRGLSIRRIDFNWPHCSKKWANMDAGIDDKLGKEQLDRLRIISGYHNRK
jgi:hypothetical protein